MLQKKNKEVSRRTLIAAMSQLAVPNGMDEETEGDAKRVHQVSIWKSSCGLTFVFTSRVALHCVGKIPRAPVRDGRRAEAVEH